MSALSSIEWTDATWNPTRGCSRVSAGCDHCYAIRQAARSDRPGGAYEGLTKKRTRLDWSGVVRLIPEKLDEPLHWKKPRRVFVNSMSDLFHESLPDEAIDKVFGVMWACRFLGRDAYPGHVFQVLTKRPERMHAYLSTDRRAAWAHWGVAYGGGIDPDLLHDGIRYAEEPHERIWLGVSVEDQKTADERIPLLLSTPAAVRFVSYEPALGPVDFEKIAVRPLRDPWPCDPTHASALWDHDGFTEKLDWVIVGGESGPGARPCDIAWIRSAVQQCKAAAVPVFVKQLGAWPYCDPTVPMPGDRSSLTDRKGGDPSEWPDDLRVREFPRMH